MHPSTEIERLRKERDELRAMYRRAVAEVESLYKKLVIEEIINEQYSKFFTKNPEYCNWMRDHDAQFEAFKNSPYYIKLSTVARLEK